VRMRREFRAGRLLFWALLIGMPFLVQLTFLSGQFSGLRSRQAIDHAQVARNIARGDGFTTNFIRPLSLVFSAKVEGHPDLLNAPLHPLLLSLAFRVLPPNDNTVVFLSVIFWVASIWIVFFLTRRMFGPKTGALAAAVLMVSLSPMMSSMAGTATMVSMFLMLLLFYLLIGRAYPDGEAEDARRQGLWPMAAIGAVLGLAVLNDYYYVAAVVPVLLFVILATAPHKNWRGAAIVAGGVVIVLLPWMVRNLVVTGNPIFTLSQYDIASHTGIHPGQSVLQHLDPQVAKAAALYPFLWENLRSVLLKVRTGIRPLLESVPMFGGLFIGPLFFASIFVTMQRRAVRSLRRLFYGVVLSFALFMLLGAFSRESLVALEPFAIIFAVGAVSRFIGAVDTDTLARGWRERDWPRMWQPAKKLIVVGVLVLLAAFPVAHYVRLGGARERPSMLKYEYLRMQAPSEGLLMSDSPWLAAWYCDRPSVWLTQAATDYDLVSQRVEPIDVLHFSGSFRADPATAWGNWWQQARLSPAPYKELTHVYAPARGEVVRRRPG